MPPLKFGGQPLLINVCFPFIMMQNEQLRLRVLFYLSMEAGDQVWLGWKSDTHPIHRFVLHARNFVSSLSDMFAPRRPLSLGFGIEYAVTGDQGIAIEKKNRRPSSNSAPGCIHLVLSDPSLEDKVVARLCPVSWACDLRFCKAACISLGLAEWTSCRHRQTCMVRGTAVSQAP